MKKNTPQDIWNFIDVHGVDDCWPWTGYLTKPKKGTGYGYIVINQKQYVAHRIVYSLEYPGSIEMSAPIDKSLRQFVLHRCDNRICCNPKHLFLGNYDDNNKDAAIKGRTSRNHGVKGLNHYKSKFKEGQIENIQWLASKGLSNGEIQKLYPVCNETIRRVVKSLSYKGT